MEYLARGSLYEYLQRQRRRSASKRGMVVAEREEVPLIEPLSKGSQGGHDIPVVRGMLRLAPAEKTPELTEVRTAAQLRHPSQCVCRPCAVHAPTLRCPC